MFSFLWFSKLSGFSFAYLGSYLDFTIIKINFGLFLNNLFRAEASDDDEEEVKEPEESRDDQRKMPRVESTLRNVFNLGKGKFFNENL